MAHFVDAQDMIDYLLKFDRLFDLVRVVDPVSKQVIHGLQAGDEPAHSNCYDFWKAGKYCDNCVSYRAMNEQNTFVKVEYDREKVYLVMASPTELDRQKYIVEMLKDITNTGIVPDLKGKTADEIYQMIDQLNKEVITDEVTQVFNRRFMDEKLPVDLYSAMKNRTKLSVIMLDIDRFKSINDRFGHACGDYVLRAFGSIIRSVIRKDRDWVARYGGDEFFITLPGADRNGANRVAEAIRKAVESERVTYGKHTVAFTVSSGSYTMDYSEKLSPSELLSHADANLYKAKHSGRNRVFSN